MTIIFPIDFTRYFCVITVSAVLLGQSLHTLLCPEDEFSWKKREIVFSCGSLSYHCGISVHGSEVEFCASPMFMEKGFCPIFDITIVQNIIEQKCLQPDGCPLEGYVTNKLYKYPSCLNGSRWELKTTDTTEDIYESSKHIVQGDVHTKSSLKQYSIASDTTNNSSVFIHITTVSHKVYSTNSPPQLADQEKLISFCAICGIAALTNIFISIYIIIYNRCAKRYAKNLDIKGKLEKGMVVAAVSGEEDNAYCEVGDLHLLERHDIDRNIIKHGCREEHLEGKESTAGEAIENMAIENSENAISV